MTWSAHTGAAYSGVAQLTRLTGAAEPLSFNGDGRLFGFNLFMMTALMCLGLMMAGRMARMIWRDRSDDHLRDPVTIWRAAWLLAGAAVFLRCGTEAMNLWAWSPADPVTTARVLMAKRWIDPVALALGGGWMLLVTLANAGIEQQLRKRPYPIDMWASMTALRRPAAVVLLSLLAAVGVAVTR